MSGHETESEAWCAEMERVRKTESEAGCAEIERVSRDFVTCTECCRVAMHVYYICP